MKKIIQTELEWKTKDKQAQAEGPHWQNQSSFKLLKNESS